MFNLKIEMGNDAMQSREDVAEALRLVVDQLESGWGSGDIHDLNGNKVGSFKLTK